MDKLREGNTVKKFWHFQIDKMSNDIIYSIPVDTFYIYLAKHKMETEKEKMALLTVFITGHWTQDNVFSYGIFFLEVLIWWQVFV